jgi:hypothetical protein
LKDIIIKIDDLESVSTKPNKKNLTLEVEEINKDMDKEFAHKASLDLKSKDE